MPGGCLIGSMGAANWEQPIPRVLSVVGRYCWTDYNRLDKSATVIPGAYVEVYAMQTLMMSYCTGTYISVFGHCLVPSWLASDS